MCKEILPSDNVIIAGKRISLSNKETTWSSIICEKWEQLENVRDRCLYICIDRVEWFCMNINIMMIIGRLSDLLRWHSIPWEIYSQLIIASECVFWSFWSYVWCFTAHGTLGVVIRVIRTALRKIFSFIATLTRDFLWVAPSTLCSLLKFVSSHRF